MDAPPAGRAARCRRAEPRPRPPPAPRGTSRPRLPHRSGLVTDCCRVGPAPIATGSPSISVKTSRRRASITGSAPGAPAASASRVETPATVARRARGQARGRGEAHAQAREAARAPCRRRCAPAPSGSASALVEQCVHVLEQATPGSRSARRARFRPRASALVATFVAVSNASVSTVDLDHASFSPPCRRMTRKRGAGSASPAASGHSTKQTAPSKYGSRSPHSAGETLSNR